MYLKHSLMLISNKIGLINELIIKMLRIVRIRPYYSFLEWKIKNIEKGMRAVLKKNATVDLVMSDVSFPVSVYLPSFSDINLSM